ncbi:MAG: hypothetical protein KF773_28980 [Deltaproteobacteria bacterium]|nr:hypothetical protein [Deltaproteobacteria bacterium]
MRIPAWLTLGVAILVLIFGAFRLWLAFRPEKKAAADGDDGAVRSRSRGIYAMRKRTHLLIGIIYMLLGVGLTATVFGWNPFGNSIGPGTTEPTPQTAPTKQTIPIDQLPKPDKK